MDNEQIEEILAEIEDFEENDGESQEDDQSDANLMDLEHNDSIDTERLLFSLKYRFGLGHFDLSHIQTAIQYFGTDYDYGCGLRLLHYLSQFNRGDCIEYVLSVRPDLEVKTQYGETPLDQACWKGHTIIALWLITAGANVNSKTNSLYTPLHRAAYYNHINLVNTLLMCGADPSAIDGNDQTPYENAVEQDNVLVAQLLEPIIINGVNVKYEYYRKLRKGEEGYDPETRSILLQNIPEDFF
eukprot:TRINITY_DN281_c1_g1_i1.p1 TRINITY_DN281_c1_g1~~TRINITY_DN281_c1_g1_i1.p1  ORF type:complete len:242 (-),score=60.92 TRINITY_DN281_c1_g1_i1:1023-1748(-)